MYPRISRVNIKGKTYEYLRIVEAYRDENGRNRQRVIANLGRLDQIGSKLDSLVEKLRRFCDKTFLLPNEVENHEAVTWGQILLIRRLWEELELDMIIADQCQGRHDFNVAEQAFVLVANRLCEPHSEHGLGRWLDATYVCDCQGKRFEPAWRDEVEVTKDQRVKLKWNWLQGWYRTLDAVYAGKNEIENELYLRLRDLFHLNVDLVFYDLTTLYFARREAAGKLRRHGNSKDGKPRNVQVLLGLVMVNGFPLAGHVFSGNHGEKVTVKQVVTDVQKRFGIGEVIFVADKGIDSNANRRLLNELDGYHYLFGHKGRRDKQAYRWLGQINEDKWRDCPRGSKVQEVDSGETGMRAFVVESGERKSYEQALRRRSMERAEAHLEKLARRVSSGRLKDAAKIGAAAARAMKKDHAQRYFSFRIDGDAKFSYWVDDEKIAAETAQEGRYILVTDHSTITSEEAVKRYKELSEVEEGFRSLKDIIEARPIYHQRDERILGHLFIAQLALLLICQLRRRLDDADIPLSARDALAAVKSLGVSTVRLGDTETVLVASQKRDCRRVLSALGIVDLQPPGTTRSRQGRKRPEMAM